MAKEAKDYGEGIGNGNSGIRQGEVFVDKEKLAQALKEGCGIIVYTEGGKTIAFGDTWNYKHPYWRDYLAKHLVTARSRFGDSAHLVRKENGLLIYEKEVPKQLTINDSKQAPSRKRKEPFFSLGIGGKAIV